MPNRFEAIRAPSAIARSFAHTTSSATRPRPAEVENVLYQNESIAEAAVIGISDVRWGQVGRAVVVPKPGRSLTEDDVVAHCAVNLARYKLPHSVVFTDALPRNATGKVHKPTLRQRFGEG